jgi:hypothetical protein
MLFTLLFHTLSILKTGTIFIILTIFHAMMLLLHNFLTTVFWIFFTVMATPCKIFCLFGTGGFEFISAWGTRRTRRGQGGATPSMLRLLVFVPVFLVSYLVSGCVVLGVSHTVLYVGLHGLNSLMTVLPGMLACIQSANFTAAIGSHLRSAELVRSCTALLMLHLLPSTLAAPMSHTRLIGNFTSASSIGGAASASTTNLTDAETMQTAYHSSGLNTAPALLAGLVAVSVLVIAGVVHGVKRPRRSNVGSWNSNQSVYNINERAEQPQFSTSNRATQDVQRGDTVSFVFDRSGNQQTARVYSVSADCVKVTFPNGSGKHEITQRLANPPPGHGYLDWFIESTASKPVGISSADGVTSNACEPGSKQVRKCRATSSKKKYFDAASSDDESQSDEPYEPGAASASDSDSECEAANSRVKSSRRRPKVKQSPLGALIKVGEVPLITDDAHVAIYWPSENMWHTAKLRPEPSRNTDRRTFYCFVTYDPSAEWNGLLEGDPYFDILEYAQRKMVRWTAPDTISADQKVAAADRNPALAKSADNLTNKAGSRKKKVAHLQSVDLPKHKATGGKSKATRQTGQKGPLQVNFGPPVSPSNASKRAVSPATNDAASLLVELNTEKAKRRAARAQIPTDKAGNVFITSWFAPTEDISKSNTLMCPTERNSVAAPSLHTEAEAGLDIEPSKIAKPRQIQLNKSKTPSPITPSQNASVDASSIKSAAKCPMHATVKRHNQYRAKSVENGVTEFEVRVDPETNKNGIYCLLCGTFQRTRESALLLHQGLMWNGKAHVERTDKGGERHKINLKEEIRKRKSRKTFGAAIKKNDTEISDATGGRSRKGSKQVPMDTQIDRAQIADTFMLSGTAFNRIGFFAGILSLVCVGNAGGLAAYVPVLNRVELEGIKALVATATALAVIFDGTTSHGWSSHTSQTESVYCVWINTNRIY